MILNIIRNALRPGFAGEMVRKVWKRFHDPVGDASAWYRERQTDLAAWARSIDPLLWDETEAFSDEQRKRARQIGVRCNGNGEAMLYFLTRLLRPRTVVETGVAYGFSSRAILRAGVGRLFSSDFPYFRVANPEKLIGKMVEPEYRDRWTLLTAGDRRNLPRIAKAAPKIDLFHYDSDKSYSGRAFALKTLAPCFTDDTLIIMDDIADNTHFRDWIGDRPCVVFGSEGRWTGITGGYRLMTIQATAASATTARTRNAISQMAS